MDTARVMLRTVGTMLRLGMRREMAYAVDVVLRLVGGALEFAVVLLFFRIVFVTAGGPGGWSFPAVAVVAAVAETVTLLFDSFLAGVEDLPGYVLDGSLDRLLLIPAPTLAVLSLSRIRWNLLPELLLPLAAIIWGATRLSGSAGGLHWGAFLVVLAAALVIRWSVSLSLVAASLVAVRADALVYFVREVLGLSRYPSSVFGGLWSVVVVVIPIAFLGNVPAAALSGGGTAEVVLTAVAVAVGWAALAVLSFRWWLRHYRGVA